jgi:ABC-type bacteriocin/lantibiotic exporter with double-glycine peptidase domain
MTMSDDKQPTAAAPAAPKRPLHERFPALRRLGITKRKRIPYISQLEWSDCGAACLAMSLAFHGKEIPLSSVRSAVGVGRDGVTARNIADAAGRFGMVARGVKVDVEQLTMLPRGSILHWEFNHFVVLDRVDRDAVLIVDPAMGPRRIPLAEVGAKLTGVALELRTGASFARERIKGSRTRSYLREVFSERPLIARVIVISLVMRVLALAMPLLTGLVVDWVLPRTDHTMLLVVTLSIAGLVMLDGVCALIRSHLLLNLRTTLDARMTLEFLDHMVSLPVGFFQRRSAGDLMLRVGSNATVRELVTSQSLSAIIDGCFVLIYAVVILKVNALLGIVALSLAALQAAIFVLARPKNQRLLAEDLDRQAKAQSYLVQVLGGMETLKTAGAERNAVERWSSLYTDTLNVSIQRGKLGAITEAIRGSVTQLAPMLILAVGARAVMNGEMTPGTMLAMTSLAISLFGPLSALTQSLLSLQLVKGYTERIDDVLRATPEQDASKVKSPHQLTGAISLRDVSFRYNQDRALVVDRVNLEIPAGAKVAIVGPSGSGKSTLIGLLAGIITPTAGKISYDNANLAELDFASVRRQLGVVPQHPFVFGSSIRENIALTVPDAPLERIANAARVASFHDDVAAMPMAYDTIISDGGASLSGGQRQRIAIARAVLRQPRVLLFDEATSALDTATEHRVVQNLRRLGCTQVTVAHRLSTVQHADVIVVMEAGRIIESGSHQQLLANNGAYAQLVRASAMSPAAPQAVAAAPRAPAPQQAPLQRGVA